jgi:predicted nucleic acid-binding protein
MRVLLDTNILGRMLEPGHPEHSSARNATYRLKEADNTLCVVPQVLYELWVVGTRPPEANGLGLTPQEMGEELSKLKTIFAYLHDTPMIYSEWERLVTSHEVTGKNAHDTRLVAAMTVHGLSQLLTFNGRHFARYPTITVVDPTSF